MWNSFVHPRLINDDPGLINDDPGWVGPWGMPNPPKTARLLPNATIPAAVFAMGDSALSFWGQSSIHCVARFNTCSALYRLLPSYPSNVNRSSSTDALAAKYTPEAGASLVTSFCCHTSVRVIQFYHAKQASLSVLREVCYASTMNECFAACLTCRVACPRHRLVPTAGQGENASHDYEGV